MRAAHKAFSSASKEIVKLCPTADELYLLIGLKDEGTPKKTTMEATKEKVVEAELMALSESSSEYDDVFYVSFSIPSKRLQKKVKEKEDTHLKGVKTVLMGIMNRLDRVESKIDKMESKMDG